VGPAIIGLVGALVGAIAALVGSVISGQLQARQESSRWRRDKRQAAYDGALRHLLRAANRRSGFQLDEGRLTPVLGEVGGWFDDLVDAQFWLRSLTTVCGHATAVRLRSAADTLDNAVKSMDWGGGIGRPLFDALTEAVTTVAECAREDLGAANRIQDADDATSRGEELV